MAACNEGQTAVEDSMALVDRETSTMQEDQDKDKNERRMILFRKIMDKFLNKIMSTGRSGKVERTIFDFLCFDCEIPLSEDEEEITHLFSYICDVLCIQTIAF
jgi:hypothetical protein